MSLTLRIPKGEKLTKEEMDNNLSYLESSSFSRVLTSEFNNFTSSYSTGSFTGSFTGDGSSLTNLNIDTSSLATTGSNTFTDNQTINGNIEADKYLLSTSATIGLPSLNQEFDINLQSTETTLGNDVIILDSGKFLVAGRFTSADNHQTDDITRLNSNGTVDTSFTTVSIGGGTTPNLQSVKKLIELSDNKIIIVGSFTSINSNTYTGVARLLSDGTLDTTFNNPNLTNFVEVRDATIQADGKVVVVGDFDQGIQRLNTDGTVDTSLNTSNTLPLNTVSVQTVDSVEYILVGGSFNTWESSTDYKKIVRLNLDGTLDTSFGGNDLTAQFLGTQSEIDNFSIDILKPVQGSSYKFVYIGGVFRGTQDGATDERYRNLGRLYGEEVTDFAGNIVYIPGTFDNSFRTLQFGSGVNNFDLGTDDIIVVGDITQSTNTGVNNLSIITYNGNSVEFPFPQSDFNFNDTTNNVVRIPNTTNMLVVGNFTQVNNQDRDQLASVKIEGSSEENITSNYNITSSIDNLIVSSSNTTFTGEIKVQDLLTLSSKDPLPASASIGSLTASGSSGNSKPYYYDGVNWNPLY